jgi:uncharacterized protein with PQ loop repeat
MGKHFKVSTTNHFEFAVGTIGTILVMIINLPLLYDIIKRKDASHISLLYILIGSISACVWISYAIAIEDIYVLSSNVVYILISITMGILRLLEKYKPNIFNAILRKKPQLYRTVSAKTEEYDSIIEMAEVGEFVE